MKELIKESLVDLKKAEGYIYLTSDGKKIDIQEAAVRGISVTPLNPKDEVIRKLEVAGLFLTDNKFVAELNEVIEALGGASQKKAGVKRMTFSSSEKAKILEEWKKVKAAGNTTKAAFAKEVGIGYQTFINWLKV